MKEKWSGLEETLIPELLNNLLFFPEAVEDFLQAWTLILQVYGFTALWMVVIQKSPASRFQKMLCYGWTGL